MRRWQDHMPLHRLEQMYARRASRWHARPSVAGTSS
ncbi:MAG: hypothetical protein IPG17_09280 [Sandaracinaceae bacterium]|nr:hypothetical protein [Sandaracinaceae bacterium]